MRRILVGIAVSILLITGWFWSAASAKAMPVTGCLTTRGLWLFHGTMRDICDGPLLPDGSWVRVREFYTPAHNVPFSCSTFGGVYYSTTNCSGGYFQPRTSNGVEVYPVTPETVLPDEPGHLVNGLVLY